MTETSPIYDALLVVTFGGPERPEDVIPFLENVLRGRHVPRPRLLEVAQHYYHFGGRSPINDQTRELIAALRAELDANGPALPIYWGCRNWHPLLPDTLRQMAADGVRSALAFVVSAYSSYSGCRQYRENIEAARLEAGPGAPRVDKLRTFYNHPGFVEPMAENVRAALGRIPESRRQDARLVYTAHSIPSSMAATSRYEDQLHEACRLVTEAAGRTGSRLVYQSRSGPPEQPWLEPDILDYLRELQEAGVGDVVVVPIGFLSDHMEVLYDLDTAAQELADQLGIHMVRAATVGTHPQFISMIRELILERTVDGAERRALGEHGPGHDVCPADCCPAPQRMKR